VDEKKRREKEKAIQTGSAKKKKSWANAIERQVATGEKGGGSNV